MQQLNYKNSEPIHILCFCEWRSNLWIAIKFFNSASKMFRLIMLHATVSLSFLVMVQCSRAALRQTVNGPIEGVVMNTTFGQEFYAFKSIPYAKPPITGKDLQTGEMVDRRFKVCWITIKFLWNLSFRRQSMDCCILSFDLLFILITGTRTPWSKLDWNTESWWLWKQMHTRETIKARRWRLLDNQCVCSGYGNLWVVIIHWNE